MEGSGSEDQLGPSGCSPSRIRGLGALALSFEALLSVPSEVWAGVRSKPEVQCLLECREQGARLDHFLHHFALLLYTQRSQVAALHALHAVEPSQRWEVSAAIPLMEDTRAVCERPLSRCKDGVRKALAALEGLQARLRQFAEINRSMAAELSGEEGPVVEQLARTKLRVAEVQDLLAHRVALMLGREARDARDEELAVSLLSNAAALFKASTGDDTPAVEEREPAPSSAADSSSATSRNGAEELTKGQTAHGPSSGGDALSSITSESANGHHANTLQSSSQLLLRPPELKGHSSSRATSRAGGLQTEPCASSSRATGTAGAADAVEGVKSTLAVAPLASAAAAGSPQPQRAPYHSPSLLKLSGDSARSDPQSGAANVQEIPCSIMPPDPQRVGTKRSHDMTHGEGGSSQEGVLMDGPRGSPSSMQAPEPSDPNSSSRGYSQSQTKNQGQRSPYQSESHSESHGESQDPGAKTGGQGGRVGQSWKRIRWSPKDPREEHAEESQESLDVTHMEVEVRDARGANATSSSPLSSSMSSPSISSSSAAGKSEGARDASSHEMPAKTQVTKRDSPRDTRAHDEENGQGILAFEEDREEEVEEEDHEMREDVEEAQGDGDREKPTARLKNATRSKHQEGRVRVHDGYDQEEDGQNDLYLHSRGGGDGAGGDAAMSISHGIECGGGDESFLLLRPEPSRRREAEELLSYLAHEEDSSRHQHMQREGVIASGSSGTVAALAAMVEEGEGGAEEDSDARSQIASRSSRDCSPTSMQRDMSMRPPLGLLAGGIASQPEPDPRTPITSSPRSRVGPPTIETPACIPETVLVPRRTRSVFDDKR